jgi:cell division protein FtsQ
MSRGDRIRTSRKIRRIRKRRAGGSRGWMGRLGRRALSLAMMASVSLLGFTAYQYLQRSAPVKVGEIKILGCMNATQSELLHLAQLDFRSKMAHLDLKEVSNRLSRHPWVEKAKVKRDWTNQAVIIEVQERVPQALILLDDLYLVDRQGEIFKKAEPKDRLDLPVLTGLNRREIAERDPGAVDLLGQALDFLQLLGQTKVFTPREVSEIHLSKQNGLTVFTVNGGMPIRVGSGELADKLRRLEKVLPDLQQKSKNVEYLDLNYPRKVVVKLKDVEKEKSRKS